VWNLAALSVAVKLRGRDPEAIELTCRAVPLAADADQPGSRLRHPSFFLGEISRTERTRTDVPSWLNNRPTKFMIRPVGHSWVTCKLGVSPKAVPWVPSGPAGAEQAAAAIATPAATSPIARSDRMLLTVADRRA